MVSCVPLSQPDIRDYLLCEHAGPSNNCPSRKDTWVIRSPSSCAVSPKRLPTPELQVMCSIYGTPYEWVTIAYTRNETCEEPASQKPRPGATRRRPKGLIPNAKVIRKLDGTANPLPVCNEENFRIPQGYAIVERFQGVNCNQLLPHTAGSISLPTQVIQLLLVYPPRSLGLYSVCTGTQLPHGYFRLPKSFHSDVCGGDPSELNTLQVKFIYTD